MRLNSLKIENFRTIKKTEITFHDKVVGIIGPNGAGKSSIIEAISWALYGNEAARTGKNEIKSAFASPKENCRVELSFQLNNDSFRIIRSLSGKSDRAEVHLFRGDESESVGVSDTQKYLRELLGLDWKSFRTSFLARQQELNSLSDLQPSKRKDYLAGMLGVERLDKAVSKVKEETRHLEKSISFIESQTSQAEFFAEELARLNSQLTFLNEKLESKSELKRAGKSAVDQSIEKLKEMQEKKSKDIEKRSQLKAQNDSLADLKEQKINLSAENEELLEENKIAAVLEKELSEYESYNKELRNLQDAKDKAKLLEELYKRETELKDELENLSISQKNCTDIKVNLDKEFSQIDSNIEGQVAKMSEELEISRDKYSQLKAEIKSIEKDEQKLNTQLDSIDSLGPESVCDRCHRELGSDLDKIKKHFVNEITEVKSKKEEAELELASTLSRGKELKELSTKLQDALTRKNELRIKIEQEEIELSRLNDFLNKANSGLSEVKAKIRAQGDFSYDEKRYDQLSLKINILNEKKEHLHLLRGKLTRLPRLNEQINQTAEKMKLTESKIKELQKEFEKIGFDESKFNEISSLFQKEQLEFEQVSSDHQETKTQLEVTKKDIESKEERLSSFAKMHESLETDRESKFYLTKLATLFVEFKAELIASIRPTLSDISSRLISEMTNGRYNLIELDEKYNLQVLDNGQFYEVDRFSGGEKDLTNLCLRLAISQALTETAGMTGSFIMLDEVFGSQDSERRDLIVDSLRNLKKIFPQIILITHLEDLKEKVEQLIQVEPTIGGWSEVTITNV